MSIETLKEASKKTVRHPTAKASIVWSDTSSENTIVTPLNFVNRAHITPQIITGRGYQKQWAFCETDNPIESVARLDNCYAMPNATAGIYLGSFLVGWWGDGTSISDSNGYFATQPHLKIELYPIPFSNYEIKGYMNQEYPLDFDLILTHHGNQTHIEEVRGNTSVNYIGALRDGEIKDVSQIDLVIRRWSHKGAFVKITAFIAVNANAYNEDDIVSLGILEETDGSIGTLPIGNISANELNLTLQNLEDKYFFGNTASLLSNSARTNRRIEAFIGFNNEVIPKGVFWSRDWEIADQGTTASTSALDRLGLLQDINYNGLGNINNQDADGEATYWKNKTLYAVATDVLMDLRNYMSDLEFDLDESLKRATIPIAFFQNQSYFDVIRIIAQAGCAFAYMDTPTAAEKELAAQRGNTRCADILRIKPLENFIAVAISEAETITRDDFIDKNTSARRSDVVNIVTVNYKKFQIDSETGKPVEIEEEEGTQSRSFTVQSDASILEFGKIQYEYTDNNLIQTVNHAADIASRILSAFSRTPYVCEIQSFGDVTLRIGNILLVPEYQKNGIDTQGYYAVTKISTDYDGGLRQNIIARKVRDNYVIDEQTDNPEAIIIESNTDERIDERIR